MLDLSLQDREKVMSKKKWLGLYKVIEECSELIQELIKLHSYPNGKHPRRRRNLKISTEEEAGDVLGSLNYFIDKNGLDRTKIDKRQAYKYRKWVKRLGKTPAMTRAQKRIKKQATKRTLKKNAVGQIITRDVQRNVKSTKTT